MCRGVPGVPRLGAARRGSLARGSRRKPRSRAFLTSWPGICTGRGIVEQPTGSAMSAPSSFAPPRLELRGISKRYPGCLANDRIDLCIDAGEIHALLGENGAGKSTLMKII